MILNPLLFPCISCWLLGGDNKKKKQSLLFLAFSCWLLGEDKKKKKQSLLFLALVAGWGKEEEETVSAFPCISCCLLGGEKKKKKQSLLFLALVAGWGKEEEQTVSAFPCISCWLLGGDKKKKKQEERIPLAALESIVFFKGILSLVLEDRQVNLECPGWLPDVAWPEQDTARYQQFATSLQVLLQSLHRTDANRQTAGLPA
eukprot:g8174.t1